MVGGDANVFAMAQPVLACYGRAVTLMGSAGSGQLTKMVMPSANPCSRPAMQIWLTDQFYSRIQARGGGR